MKLSEKDKKRMAADNYNEFREKVKFGDRPPLTGAQQRQTSSGKGDGSRVVNRKAYENNYGLIKWKRKK